MIAAAPHTEIFCSIASHYNDETHSSLRLETISLSLTNPGIARLLNLYRSWPFPLVNCPPLLSRSRYSILSFYLGYAGKRGKVIFASSAFIVCKIWLTYFSTAQQLS